VAVQLLQHLELRAKELVVVAFVEIENRNRDRRCGVVQRRDVELEIAGRPPSSTSRCPNLPWPNHRQARAVNRTPQSLRGPAWVHTLSVLGQHVSRERAATALEASTNRFILKLLAIAVALPDEIS
jgi:hypothetical protein